MSQWIKWGCLGIWLSGIASNAWAGVIVGGTRVVYNSEKREASISVKNPDKSIPYLIQSWVESESGSAEVKAPFIITPPLFRLDTEQENTLRIVRIDGQLPSNKETVYWLNIKSIPATERTEQNTLQISVKTRIKMFYRPAGLSGNASEAYKFQRFTKNGNQLQVNNPTPYYVSFLLY
ncbi:molecular chaperone [Pseudomonas shahriarae]|uniref:fimbrial biogenesis chaperone n=1 Tax=Pseudomonas shahriarae TaxID=2745512 RepID=UPI00235FB4F4|nr:molecular chaperone [Pseudomonas shahriarae]MDD1134185.1 molecular chaperone [Pseudomonas shahriarae]